MNNVEQLQAREAYFNQYRSKMCELETTIKTSEQVRKEYKQAIDECTDRLNDLNTELHAMRSIITYMLDHGCDPVEAKLVLTDDNRSENLWEKHEYEKDLYGSLKLNTLLGATGAITGTISTIGAIGANGPAATISPYTALSQKHIYSLKK